MPDTLGLVEGVCCCHCWVTQGHLQIDLNLCCGHFKFSPANLRGPPTYLNQRLIKILSLFYLYRTYDSITSDIVHWCLFPRATTGNKPLLSYGENNNLIMFCTIKDTKYRDFKPRKCTINLLSTKQNAINASIPLKKPIDI
jgi:hypothetical protein